MSNFKFPITNTIQKYFGIVLMILFGLTPLLSLFHPGLPITHDGQDHVARIANFYQSLSEGNIIPRWAANLNWGFGHPILMFLYPLPSYLASLFHFLGFNFIDSVKLVFGIAYVGSGIAMYLWMKEYLGEKAGIIAGLFYMFAPYRFVDLYVRGAIGEHVAFVFMPLILFFLLKLSERYSYWYIVGGGVSIAGLLLSHNAISIMFLPFIIFYGGFLSFQQKSKLPFLYQCISILVIGFGLSAFFLLPAFSEGKYTLRDIVTGHQEYAKSFVDPISFFWGPWSYGGSQELSKQIGILQILGVIVSGILIFNSKIKNLKIFYGVVFLYGIGSLFLMIRESDFIWQAISILQKFQFPWRFLSITVLITAILSGIGFAILKKKYLLNIMFAFFVLSIFFYKNYWYPKGYLTKSEDFFAGIYNSTTDTGESSPKWSVRFMEKRPSSTIELLSGSAKIQKISRSTTTHTYTIDVQEESRIKDNTVYFPGWNVYIDNKIIPTNQIQFQDQLQRGLITFRVPQGMHEVRVQFDDTKIRTIANAISLLTFFGVIIGGVYFIVNKRVS